MFLKILRWRDININVTSLQLGLVFRTLSWLIDHRPGSGHDHYVETSVEDRFPMLHALSYQIFFLLFLKYSFRFSQIQPCKFFHKRRFLSHPIFFSTIDFWCCWILVDVCIEVSPTYVLPTHKLYLNTRLAQVW